MPEGAGPVPTACSGRGLSDYRIYVPDCRAHEGILGARNPYVIDGYTGKIGTWCNKYDILCSSYYSIKSHTSYVEDGLYEDASKLLFSKIAKVFEIKNEYTSPHDTAILIDSTGSMDSLIDQYKAEALNLAQKTLDAGGRVALYDYRDLADDYTPIERCNFETCTIDTFQSGLEAIQTDNGGDAAESLLSASVHVMQHLEWRLGSTKSLVILTDDGYHSPDLDGTTFYDVKRISQQIDPVNFYIITTDDNMELYQSLAEATGGSVTSNMSNLSILTDTIMEKYDSLPRVEEEFADVTDDTSLSHLTISQIEENDGSIKINFDTDGIATIVILNDAILGATDQHDITFTDLNNNVINTVTLVPLSNTRRGEPVSTSLNATSGYGSVDAPTSSNLSNSSTSPSLPNFPQNFTIPKAPNTGRK
ncbi:VWA domain-containing protein [Candidatus Saccharibacteria bacterium]|nr:VWA domain-containing protein [Candidatus Saccharibacteria bacterium]